MALFASGEIPYDVKGTPMMSLAGETSLNTDRELIWL